MEVWLKLAKCSPLSNSSLGLWWMQKCWISLILHILISGYLRYWIYTLCTCHIDIFFFCWNSKRLKQSAVFYISSWDLWVTVNGLFCTLISEVHAASNVLLLVHGQFITPKNIVKGRVPDKKSWRSVSRGQTSLGYRNSLASWGPSGLPRHM